MFWGFVWLNPFCGVSITSLKKISYPRQNGCLLGGFPTLPLWLYICISVPLGFFNLEIFVIIFSGKSFCAQLHWLKTVCVFVGLLIHGFCLNKNLFLLLFYHWPTINTLPKIIFSPTTWALSGKGEPTAGKKRTRKGTECWPTPAGHRPHFPRAGFNFLLLSLSGCGQASQHFPKHPLIQDSRAASLLVWGPLAGRCEVLRVACHSPVPAADSVSHWGMACACVILIWSFWGFIILIQRLRCLWPLGDVRRQTESWGRPLAC